MFFDRFPRDLSLTKFKSEYGQNMQNTLTCYNCIYVASAPPLTKVHPVWPTPGLATVLLGGIESEAVVSIA